MKVDQRIVQRLADLRQSADREPVHDGRITAFADYLRLREALHEACDLVEELLAARGVR